MKPPSKPRLRQHQSKIQLKASSSRTTAHSDDELDSEDEGHSMKLSHAFFIVLILHLILIGGIFGFNYMKARQLPSFIKPSSTNNAPSTSSERLSASGTKENEKPLPLTQQNNEQQQILPPHNTAETLPIPQAPPAPPVVTQRAIATEKLHPPRFRSHKIKEGETLQKIASSYGVTVAQIKKANNGINNKIFIGEVLQIPPRTAHEVTSGKPAEKPQAASVTPRSSTQSPPQQKGKQPSQQIPHGAKGTVSQDGKNKIYTVVPGDNPYSIARRLKVSYTQLMSLNHIQDPTKLKIGAKLKIPAGKTEIK